MELLSHLQTVAEYAKKSHPNVYTFIVFLSETHPDRFVLLRRFNDDAARAELMFSPESKNFFNYITNELKLKTKEYSNFAEHRAFGWTSRDHVNTTTIHSKNTHTHIIEAPMDPAMNSTMDSSMPSGENSKKHAADYGAENELKANESH
jgi:hypothetical protein